MASKEKIMLLFLPTEAQIHKILSLKNGSPNTKFYNEEEDGYGIEPWNLNGWQNSESNEIFYFFKTKKSSTGKGICRESKVKGYHWKNTHCQSICNETAYKTVLSFRPIKGYREEFQKGWVIHEYKLKECNVGSDWVLCRVKKPTKEVTPPKTLPFEHESKKIRHDPMEQPDSYVLLNKREDDVMVEQPDLSEFSNERDDTIDNNNFEENKSDPMEDELDFYGPLNERDHIKYHKIYQDLEGLLSKDKNAN